jgi:phosphoglucosamine mutase
VARRYFGTDGVRGVVGDLLTEELVARLGVAYGRWSGSESVLVGRDTRSSGPDLERALARGLEASGSRVLSGGILPTPAVALLAEESGAVISASHNPPEYNGVKFFRRGWKLEDVEEEEIEALLEHASGPGADPPPRDGGAVCSARYVDLVCERFGRPLEGLRVVVDCANGAMYEVAPRVFERLGAHVVTIGNRPDGANINVGCGATDLSLLSRTVAEGDFHLGVAFDGDGDRMLAVDANGDVVDGDGIVAICALAMGVDLVAVTSMTNLGFHRLMDEHGIRVVTTDVGDRYVLEALRREGGILGGEQSGHLIVLEGHVTGDGLAAALTLCRALGRRSLAEAASVMRRFPQAKGNVRVSRLEVPEAVTREVERLNAELEGRGRVLVRPSGTEPVIRVLAEAERAEEAADLCASIANLVRQEAGAR